MIYKTCNYYWCAQRAPFTPQSCAAPHLLDSKTCPASGAQCTPLTPKGRAAYHLLAPKQAPTLGCAKNNTVLYQMWRGAALWLTCALRTPSTLFAPNTHAEGRNKYDAVTYPLKVHCEKTHFQKKTKYP